MTQDQTVQDAIKKITLWIAREKPYLFLIDKHITEVNNGIVNISFRVYNGFVTDVVFETQKRHIFKYGQTNKEG